MTDRETHTTIEFKPFAALDLEGLSPAEIVVYGHEPCPRCHRVKLLGVCGDGCKMCQSCFTLMHGGEPLPSDAMS